MKLHTLLLATALVLPASAVLAQRVEAPTKLAASSSDVQALIAKAKAMPPKPLISQNILGMAPYQVNLEYRPIPGAAPAIHDKQFELIYVLEGTGTFTVGGKVENGAIVGGATSHIAKGDFEFIPAGTPHLSVPDNGVALALMVMHGPGEPAAP
jgi:mannose-6-phosphate isomerase-like protein (cupin superfamily)